MVAKVGDGRWTLPLTLTLGASIAAAAVAAQKN